MKVLVQRVEEAACYVDGELLGAIDQGLVLFVSFRFDDDLSLLPKMAKKVAHLRIFEDDFGKMNDNVLARSKQVLSISQFTLEAATRKGHRPSFTDALPPEKAEQFYYRFNEALMKEGLTVKTGSFQAYMKIHLINDGPVTILLERRGDNDS